MVTTANLATVQIGGYLRAVDVGFIRRRQRGVTTLEPRRVSGRPVLSPGAGFAGEARASSGTVFHDAVVGAAGSGAAGAGAVAAEHLGRGPAVEFHQVALGAAAVQPGVAEVVPEPVREHVDAALSATAGDHLVDAAGGHRAAAAGPEPQLRPVRLAVPGADADVPVDAAGGPEADLDGPGLPPLAVDGDLPQLQVDVAVLRVIRVIRVIPDLRQLRQPDPGGPEHGDHGGVAARLERAARAGPLQPRQVFASEDRDGLVGGVRRPQPGHRVRDLLLGGEPFEELPQRPVLVAGVRGAVPAQQPHHPLLHVLLAGLFPAGPAGLLEQVGGGEPGHRLGVGPDCLGGLALGGQVQAERADLRLEACSVQLLGLPATGLWCGHDFPLLALCTADSRSAPGTGDRQAHALSPGTFAA